MSDALRSHTAMPDKLPPDDLRAHEAHLEALKNVYEEVSKQRQELGELADGLPGEGFQKDLQRQLLDEALRQLRLGVMLDQGCIPELTRFLGLPGMDATERIITRLRKQAEQAAVNPNEEHEYRLKVRPDGSVGSYSIPTGKDSRPLKRGEVIRISNARIRFCGDLFERVE